MKSLQIALTAVLVWLAGCTPMLAPAPTYIPPRLTFSPSASLTPTEIKPSSNGEKTLRIWLPPQFDTNSTSPAGQLLHDRLNEFISSRPDVNIEVRVKATEGSASLLDTLVAASSAAPQVVPDLIALPHPALEVAALKGLLHPFDGLNHLNEDSDWYDYARQLGLSQNNQFGLPFAGDALILVYRPATIPRPPGSLTETLALNSTLLIPVADPEALIQLALYQAAGGKLQDEQGHPMLEKAALTSMLSFFYAAGQAHILPSWTAQYEGDAQSWDAFQSGQANMVITWASHYLGSADGNIAAAPMPTPGNIPFTYATGWTWALSNPHSPNVHLSAQLAEFLCSSDFLTEFASNAGYLPLHANGHAGKQNDAQPAYDNQVALTAQLMPNTSLIASLAAPIQQATLKVLKQEINPATAADQAIKSLGGQ